MLLLARQWASIVLIVLLAGVCRLSSSVALPAGGQTGCRTRGLSGGRHYTAGQYGYVPGRHLVKLNLGVALILLPMLG